jgi:hypothetical protein
MKLAFNYAIAAVILRIVPVPVEIGAAGAVN